MPYSSSVSVRVPTEPPITTARITNASHPKTAFFRCCALHLPARAAMLFLRVTVSPLPSLVMAMSLRLERCRLQCGSHPSVGAANRTGARRGCGGLGSARAAAPPPPGPSDRRMPRRLRGTARGRGTGARRATVHPRAPRRLDRVRQAHLSGEHDAGLPGVGAARLRARAGREAHQGPRAGGDPRPHARPHHAVHRPGERAHLRELLAECRSDILGTTATSCSSPRTTAGARRSRS